MRAKLTINEERKLEADAPTGSRFKGYASFLVQDLVIRPHVTDFLRACWRTPDGKTVIAPLPPGVDIEFWDYLSARLQSPRLPRHIPALAEIVAAQAPRPP